MKIRQYIVFILAVLCGCEQPKQEEARKEKVNTLSPQITRTAVDFSLKVDGDSTIYKILSFYKHKDSSSYYHFKYTCNCEGQTLAKQKKLISDLWSIANDSININLRSVDIGYLYTYPDLLRKHIDAFQKDSLWNAHVKNNGKTLEYDLIRNTMLKHSVYDDLEQILKEHGYTIDHFSTEKHGFVTPDILEKQGYSGNEIIPMPFIVMAVLRKSID